MSGMWFKEKDNAQAVGQEHEAEGRRLVSAPACGSRRKTMAKQLDKSTKQSETKEQHLVSLKKISADWEVDRATARRLLRDAGIQPLILGNGRNGSIRYALAEIQAWLQSRERA